LAGGSSSWANAADARPNETAAVTIADRSIVATLPMNELSLVKKEGAL
jgi:hypothetical protein